MDVSPGYHFVGHNDDMTKVGEYETLSSGAQGEVKAKADVSKLNMNVHAFHYDKMIKMKRAGRLIWISVEFFN